MTSSSDYSVTNDGKTVTKTAPNGWTKWLLGTDEMSEEFSVSFKLSSVTSSVAVGLNKPGDVVTTGERCSLCVYMRPHYDGDWGLRRGMTSTCPTGKTCNSYTLVTNDDTHLGDVWTFSRTATTISVLKNSVVVYSESNGDTFVPFVGIANNGDSIEVTQSHLEYTTSNGEAPPGTVCVSECYNVNEAVPGKKNQRYSGQAPTYT